MSRNATLSDFTSADDSGSARSPAEPDNELSSKHITNAESVCPVYKEALEEWSDTLGEYDICDPKCGHAIDYLCSSVRSKLAVGTVRQYAIYARLLIEFLHKEDVTLVDAELHHFERFMEDQALRGRAKKTLSLYRTVIVNLLKHIQLRREPEPNEYYADVRELIELDKYRVEEEIERCSLKASEVKALHECMDSFRDRLILHVFVTTGMRNIDLRKLKVDDVNTEQKTVRFTNTKSNSTHSLPISAELAMLLEHWKRHERLATITASESKYLFPNSRGGQLTAKEVNAIIRTAAEEANIQEVIKEITRSDRQQKFFGRKTQAFYRVTAHTLRHTFNRLMRDAGVKAEVRTWAMDHTPPDVRSRFYEDKDFYYEEFEEALPLITFN